MSLGPVFDAALAAQAACEKIGLPFCIIGGFAERTRVVLLRSDHGVGIDVVLAGLPYEARVIDRSSPWKLDDSTTLRTCSAEDLLVMKAFAARDKDWADVTSILERQGLGLDLDLVRRELRPLVEAKEQPEIASQLERRIERHIGKRD